MLRPPHARPYKASLSRHGFSTTLTHPLRHDRPARALRPVRGLMTWALRVGRAKVAGSQVEGGELVRAVGERVLPLRLGERVEVGLELEAACLARRALPFTLVIEE